MKLDYNCIRHILLSTEKLDDSKITTELLSDESYSSKTISEHIKCLLDVDYIEVSGPIRTMRSEYDGYIIHRLTMQGHQYLDSVRDDAVWKKTLRTIGSKTTSISLDIVKEVATSFIKASLGLS